jgi:MHS family proline/betaine transporter-like MFS transporter
LAVAPDVLAVSGAAADERTRSENTEEREGERSSEHASLFCEACAVENRTRGSKMSRVIYAEFACARVVRARPVWCRSRAPSTRVDRSGTLPFVKQSAIRTAAAGLIGNVLEWFDFAVYGYFATDIGKRFFPESSPSARQLLSLAVFALGFLARPIGSIVLGMVGDRIGRRALLTLSIGLMGGATLAIGLLPTFAQIGVAAPLLLVVLRLVQGFSLGGEFTGSMVYTTEIASPALRGLVSSSTAAGTTIGFILGSISAWAVNRALGSAASSAWGWRIPFIASVVFCIAGWLLRRGIAESEAGEKAAGERPPVLSSLAADLRPIVQTFGIVAMTNAAYYLTFTFAVERRKSMSGEGGEVFLLANTLSLVVVLLSKPLGGWLSDRVGRRRLMLVLTGVTMAAVVFALHAMLYGSTAKFIGGQLLMAVPLGMMLGLQGAMVVEIFPLRTRVTSMSVAYSVTLALAGGTAPLLSTWLLERFHDPTLPAYCIILYGVIGLAIMAPMRETNGRALDA